MLNKLQRIVTDCLSTTANLPNDPIIAYHSIASSLYIISSIIREAENKQLSRSEILTVIEPLKLLCSQSPFISRIQKWPKGYPGDFETIEYLCENIVKAVPNTLAFYVEHLALSGT